MTRFLFTILCLAFSLPASADPDGSALFSRYCAACHGADGRGGVGVPIALPAFLGSVTDDYLANTIRLGRPGRVMPGFPSLSPAEVDAIVAHIRRWAPGGGPSLAAGPVVGDPTAGRAHYEAHCAACHGADGEGGKGTGVTFSRPRDLPIIAPALNNPGFLAAASDAMIKATLMQGREGTPMVSFLKQGLTERDIDDVVAYVRSFEGRAPAHSAEILEAERPVLVLESPYSVEETIANVKRAAQGKNFRIIREQLLEQNLAEEGKEHPGRAIVYFCNFQFLYEALALDPRVGLFLPCRVTVVQAGDKVLAMAINPKHLSRLFNNSELNTACDRMYKTYVEILEEATL